MVNGKLTYSQGVREVEESVIVLPLLRSRTTSKGQVKRTPNAMSSLHNRNNSLLHKQLLSFVASQKRIR